MTALVPALTALALFAALSAHAADGLVSLKSPLGVKATMDKLEAVAKAKGLVVFARVDHAAGAAKVGQTLRPTEVLIFGNPASGTPLMACAQTAGIDLPQKALVWEDPAGDVWLGYNAPDYIAQRHAAPQCGVVENLKKALAGLAAEATAR